MRNHKWLLTSGYGGTDRFKFLGCPFEMHCRRHLSFACRASKPERVGRFFAQPSARTFHRPISRNIEINQSLVGGLNPSEKY